MSLLSTDISKVKKLPFKGITTPEKVVEAPTEESFNLASPTEPSTPKRIKPISLATGRLKELEDLFIKDKSIKQRERIISLLDKLKRESLVYPEEDLLELEKLLKPEEVVIPETKVEPVQGSLF